MTNLPSHGRLDCIRCFPSETKWGFSTIEQNGWLLENNPMSWGAVNPLYLLLGFSKGARQCEKLLAAPHNEVPYAGFRHNVTAILRKLSLLSPTENVESRIHEAERDFAFGSLIRCSVAYTDSVSGIASKSGNIINRLARRTEGDDWAKNCSQQFLSTLPSRLRVVILLSNDDDYVDACFSRLRRLHPKLRLVNSVAYSDGHVMWVHTVHGSSLAQSHINNWLAGTNDAQGRKQREALDAVRRALTLSKEVSDLVHEEKAEAPKEISSFQGAPSRVKPAPAIRLARPIPKNPTRDAVHAALTEHSELRPHPLEAKETKYIAAFLTTNGRTLALDKMSAGKQPIWTEARYVKPDALPEIKKDHYPSGKGRNSNLHKLPGFKNGDLVRFYPETANQAISIVRYILGQTAM